MLYTYTVIHSYLKPMPSKTFGSKNALNSKNHNAFEVKLFTNYEIYSVE